MNTLIIELPVHDLQDSPAVLMMNKNDTEDVDLTFNLVSKVYIPFRVRTLQNISYSSSK